MTQPERNTTVNAGPAIEPAPPIGGRVTVHAWPFHRVEPGVLIAIDVGHPPEYMVALDSEPNNPYWFWAGEVEVLNV